MAGLYFSSLLCSAAKIVLLIVVLVLRLYVRSPLCCAAILFSVDRLDIVVDRDFICVELHLRFL